MKTRIKFTGAIVDTVRHLSGDHLLLAIFEDEKGSSYTWCPSYTDLELLVREVLAIDESNSKSRNYK